MRQSLPVLTPKLICACSADAIEFYSTVFGAVETERFATPQGTIVQAMIDIRGTALSLADGSPEQGNTSPDHLQGSAVVFTLQCDDPDAVAELAVEHGATLVFPVDDRFYGRREGRIRDPFGHLWILSRQTKELSREEIQRAVDEFDASS